MHKSKNFHMVSTLDAKVTSLMLRLDAKMDANLDANLDAKVGH